MPSGTPDEYVTLTATRLGEWRPTHMKTTPLGFSQATDTQPPEPYSEAQRSAMIWSKALKIPFVHPE